MGQPREARGITDAIVVVTDGGSIVLAQVERGAIETLFAEHPSIGAT